MTITYEQQILFLRKIGPIAWSACKKFNGTNSQLWACIAQAANESRWGTSNLYKFANSCFYIKVTEEYAKENDVLGIYYKVDTGEIINDDIDAKKDTYCRGYRNLKDCFYDYFQVLSEKNLWKKLHDSVNVSECLMTLKCYCNLMLFLDVNSVNRLYKAYKKDIQQYNIKKNITGCKTEKIEKISEDDQNMIIQKLVDEYNALQFIEQQFSDTQEDGEIDLDNISDKYMIPEYYIVMFGDTIDSISDVFMISHEKIKQLNNLNVDQLYIGQILRLREE